jgi:hypothetical protein
MFYVLSEGQKHKGVEYGIRYALDMYITDEEDEQQKYEVNQKDATTNAATSPWYKYKQIMEERGQNSQKRLHAVMHDVERLG